MNTNGKIKFTYKDVPYTLEYDRDVIRQLEGAGFNLKDIRTKPMLSFDFVFKGAFLKNHRNIKDSLIEEIYSHMSNKEELIQTLVSMMSDCYTTLLDDESSDEGNIKWGTTDLN